SPVPRGRTVGRPVSFADDVAALDADERRGIPAEACIPDDRGLGADHRLPALEMASVLIDHARHEGAHREGPPSPGIRPIVEDLADVLEFVVGFGARRERGDVALDGIAREAPPRTALSGNDVAV